MVKPPRPKHPVIELPKAPALKTSTIETPKGGTAVLPTPKPVPPNSYLFKKKFTKEFATPTHTPAVDTQNLRAPESLMWWWWNLFTENTVRINIMTLMFVVI